MSLAILVPLRFQKQAVKLRSHAQEKTYMTWNRDSRNSLGKVLYFAIITNYSVNDTMISHVKTTITFIAM